MEAVAKQEFRVRDLPTNSVTLFPTRAQVVRDIKNVSLKPGANQITVVGFSPTVEEESIKVEGTGSALITDIAIELLPNREIFEEIYPSEDETSEDGDSGEEGDSDDDENKSLALVAVQKKLTGLRDDLRRIHEIVNSADFRLEILGGHAKTLDSKREVMIDEALDKYRLEREKIFRDQMDGSVQVRELESQIKHQAKEEAILLSLEQKEKRKKEKIKEKALKLKRKEKEMKQRRREEKKREKERVQAERESFWPRQTYSVRISLDSTSFSPMSSRRNSVSTDTVTEVPDKEDKEDSPQTCDISISYVTSAAYWAPSYDLALSTTSNTGMLCFDALLTNKTSETWAGCKVILSTSQATFSGIKDAIPVLMPWRVKLAPRGGQMWDDILDSQQERVEADVWRNQQNQIVHQAKPRAQLFGRGSYAPQFRSEVYEASPLLSDCPRGAAPPPPAPMLQSIGSGNLSRSAAHQPRVNVVQLPRMKRHAARTETALYKEEEAYEDGATITPEPTPELAFQESLFQETGLSETYDLAGLKTLAPGNTASKQRVVRVSFSSLAFSHTVVAKCRPAAFLKVKVQNRSKLTLLKGPVGLTLDGSFMGRSTLPRCSSGDFFTMSLGVDPAIKVAYPKPEVRRSTQGLFTKEDNSAYTRAITIVNTRAGPDARPASLVVYDQAPKSEDERLRVEVLAPRGLSVGGPGVLDGAPYQPSSAARAGDEKAAAAATGWGKATAALRKENIVTWDVTLNAGKGVRLGLEYTVGWPAGEHVMQC